MVNTLTAQLVGIAKVPLYSWGNTPGDTSFNPASFGPVVRAVLNDVSAPGFLAGVNFIRLLPNGGIMQAQLAGYTGGNSGDVNQFSYFDNLLRASPRLGQNNFSFAQTSFGFVLPPPVQALSPVPPTIRGSSQIYVNNANTINVPFPAGAQVGDDCYVFTQHGFGTHTPAGWTLVGSASGDFSTSAVLKKNLTASDIATGFVTVTFGGTYFGFCMALDFTAVTTAKSIAQSGGTSVTVTPAQNAIVAWFGACRGNGAVTSNRGVTQQTTANNEGSGILTAELGVSSTNLTATFTYPGNSGQVSTGVVITGGSPINQNITLQNRPQVQLDTVFQTNKGNYTPYYPFMWQGRKAAATWFNGQNPGASVDVWVTDTNNFIVHALDLSSIGFLATYNVAMHRLIPGAAALSNVAQFDAVVNRWPGASGVGPAPIAPPSVSYINTLTGNMATLTTALDNSALQAMWAANAQPVNPTIFPYGFIYALPVTSAGNIGPLTGQSREVLVFNTDMTQYYAIQFIPQDAASATALAAGGADFFDFRWSIAIDEFGVVWFSNGLNNGIYTSYSPLNFFIPSIQAPPLNPFTLPCYNTCSPVDFAEP